MFEALQFRSNLISSLLEMFQCPEDQANARILLNRLCDQSLNEPNSVPKCPCCEVSLPFSIPNVFKHFAEECPKFLCKWPGASNKRVPRYYLKVSSVMMKDLVLQLERLHRFIDNAQCDLLPETGLRSIERKGLELTAEIEKELSRSYNRPPVDDFPQPVPAVQTKAVNSKTLFHNMRFSSTGFKTSEQEKLKSQIESQGGAFCMDLDDLCTGLVCKTFAARKSGKMIAAQERSLVIVCASDIENAIENGVAHFVNQANIVYEPLVLESSAEAPNELKSYQRKKRHAPIDLSEEDPKKPKPNESFATQPRPDLFCNDVSLE